MLFGFLKQKRQEKADDQQHWRERWQSLVPEENRSVPVTVDGQTRIAYIQINQFVVMLQDGLLMKAHFFDVCEFFQKAGYHVVWLMRCVQDVEGGGTATFEIVLACAAARTFTARAPPPSPCGAAERGTAASTGASATGSPRLHTCARRQPPAGV